MISLKTLALILLFAFIIRADHHEEQAVITLTTDNFDGIVNPAPLILVEFYAPWCGHCKHLEPEYEAAAKILKEQGIPLGKVDATVEQELGSRFAVQGYPTIKLFRNGQPSDYDGPRDAKGIVAWMEKKSGPASKPLTEADLEAFKQKDDIVMVGFFDPDHASLKVYRDAAAQLVDNFQFGEIVGKSKHKNQVVMYRRFSDELVFDGKLTVDDLSAWVKQNSVELVGEYKATNAERYRHTGLPVLKVFFEVDHVTNVKRTNYYLRRLQKIAPQFAGKMLFAISHKSVLHEPSQFGASGEDKVVVGIEDQNDQRYPFKEQFNVETLQKFVHDYLDGKVKPFLKSEPVPEDNSGPVKVIVGETFNSIVLDESKDVFIEFYAPWCGHCKTLAPKYEKLGEKVAQAKNMDNVVIAKVDATANDVPSSQFSVRGYPTIYFKPAGKDPKVVPYEGDREVDAMFKWIKKNMVSGGGVKDEL